MTTEIRMTVFIELNYSPKIIAKQFLSIFVNHTMNVTKFVRVSCAFLTFFTTFLANSAQAGFTDTASIQSFLRDNFSNTNSGMVIALLDEHGTKIYHAGKHVNGTDQE